MSRDSHYLVYVVAPHAGAWIETPSPRTCVSVKARSRLTQARGLKLFLEMQMLKTYRSRLTQARGLKPVLGLAAVGAQSVAPHAGAWIETNIVVVPEGSILRRASRRRVD